uniref:Uncharacterized protein n=1 Tax=Timema tahoe TaxID=61484 RepID=A0A7R9IMA6_9NEOP|nr:unnamed protein product [Timema tahoe]
MRRVVPTTIYRVMNGAIEKSCYPGGSVPCLLPCYTAEGRIQPDTLLVPPTEYRARSPKFRNYFTSPMDGRIGKGHGFRYMTWLLLSLDLALHVLMMYYVQHEWGSQHLGLVGLKQRLVIYSSLQDVETPVKWAEPRATSQMGRTTRHGSNGLDYETPVKWARPQDTSQMGQTTNHHSNGPDHEPQVKWSRPRTTSQMGQTTNHHSNGPDHEPPVKWAGPHTNTQKTSWTVLENVSLQFSAREQIEQLNSRRCLLGELKAASRSGDSKPRKVAVFVWASLATFSVSSIVLLL